MRSLLAVAVLCAALIGLSLPGASAAEDCGFVQGFAVIRDLIPDRVGDCRENARSTENGDVQQLTTGGLLAWRKHDNWTAFTNGFRTWVNGPCGLQERAEDQRFLWEISNFTPCTEPGTVVFTEDTTRPTPTVNTAPTATSTPIPTATPQPPTPLPTVAPQPIERHGTTSQNTTAFRLAGGAYTIAWSVDVPDGGYCGVYLNPVDGSFGQLVINEAFDAGHHSGDTRVYGVAAGDYYFRVIGCGSWSLSVRRYSP